MAQSMRTLSMCRGALNSMRPAPTPTSLLGATRGRRNYSIEDKYKEREPGGQRRLIIGSTLAVAALGVMWLRGRSGDISGAGHGANQEYKKSAEGNN